MVEIKTKPIDGGFELENPIEADKTSLVLRVEFNEKKERCSVHMLQSITGSRFVEFAYSDPEHTHEFTISGLTAGQKIQIFTKINPDRVCTL